MRAGMDRYVNVRSALLERDHEVDRLQAMVRAAGRRSGEALVIEGAAGIGKSRLLDRARADAAELGLRVLDARATELERGFPFGVMRQLFERLLVEADAHERELWLAGAAGLASEVLAGADPRRRPGAVRGRFRLRLAARALLARVERGLRRPRSCSSSTICSGATCPRCGR